MTEQDFRSGYIALVGRPNVGKSTLLNALVGRKVSIVTPKAQTTRHRILGIRNTPDAQFVFLDTPGMHRKAGKAVNRYMNRTAAAVLDDVNLILLVLDGGRWTEEDDWVLASLSSYDNVGVVVNKIDTLKPRERLLPFLEQLATRHAFRFIVPVAALTGENLARLDTALSEQLPVSEPLYPADQATDQSEHFFVAELVREQLMLRLHEELPYALTVTVDEYRDENTLLRIGATIWVEREGQKAIVIGHRGQVLKAVGQAVRTELETRFQVKVFLQLWVKVRAGWSDDERKLRDLGYT